MSIIIISVFLLLVVVVVATMLNNKARLFEPPGLAARLSVYLGQHEAQTADDHSFAELRTPRFKMRPESLFKVVIAVAHELGWSIEHEDDENLSAHLVVSTPLLGFKDDVHVQVRFENEAAGNAKSSLWLRSSSRVGKADFAANAGHIQTLVAAVKYKIRLDILRMYDTPQR